MYEYYVKMSTTRLSYFKPCKAVQVFLIIYTFRSSGVGAFAARWQSLRAAALQTAESYWQVSRRTRSDVKVIAAGLEPQAFTDLFDTWAEHDEAAEANIAVSGVN